MTEIRVVCAVVFNSEGKILIAKRSGAKNSGLWEFAGGKVEIGESDQDALSRELQEEWNVDNSVHEKLFESTFEKVNQCYKLVFYRVELESKHIHLNEHSEVKFVSIQEISLYPIIEGDLQFVEFLKGNYQ